jgi:hypothetical protein
VADIDNEPAACLKSRGRLGDSPDRVLSPLGFAWLKTALIGFSRSQFTDKLDTIAFACSRSSSDLFQIAFWAADCYIPGALYASYSHPE